MQYTFQNNITIFEKNGSMSRIAAYTGSWASGPSLDGCGTFNYVGGVEKLI